MTRRVLLVLLAAALVAGGTLGQPPATPSPASDPPPVQGDTRDAAEVLEDGAGDASGSAWPDWSERWLFNADERTERGRRALESEATDAAVERFDTALRLRSDDAVARFNAGTARLSDQRPGARELLEAAVRDAPERVKAPASYNLGNARMSAGDLPGAIAAYEDALRSDPDFGDAKHNLEVALRRLQQQQQNQQNQDQNQDQQQDQEQQQDQQQQDQQQDQTEDQQQQQDQEQQDEQKQQEQQQQQDQDQEQQKETDETKESGGAGQGGKESPLPQFEDLPDMTAEEAAAILEAIQNMERQDRREQALEAAKKAEASGKKDW